MEVYDTTPGLGMVTYGLGPGVTAMEDAARPLGARGALSGREFDPDAAGGPIRRLSTARIRITDRRIDVIERHVARFGPDPANQAMIQRLRDIAAGRFPPSEADLIFYAHELREFVRHRRQGFPMGAGDDYELWNDTHTATLEDYSLSELDADGNRNLFHPDAWPLLPR